MSVDRSETETFSVPGGCSLETMASGVCSAEGDLSQLPHFTAEHWDTLSSGKAGYGVFPSLGANRLVIPIWLCSISGEPEMPGVHCVCRLAPSQRLLRSAWFLWPPPRPLPLP